MIKLYRIVRHRSVLAWLLDRAALWGTALVLSVVLSTLLSQ